LKIKYSSLGRHYCEQEGKNSEDKHDSEVQKLKDRWDELLSERNDEKSNNGVAARYYVLIRLETSHQERNDLKLRLPTMWR
jgi:hypothetical protein